MFDIFSSKYTPTKRYDYTLLFKAIMIDTYHEVLKHFRLFNDTYIYTKSKVRISILNECLRKSCIRGDLNIFNIFINIPEVDPWFNNNACLIMAIKKCNIDIVSRLLLYPKLNINIQGGDALITACSVKCDSIASLILSFDGTDPNTIDNLAVEECIHNEMYHTLTEIISHPKVSHDTLLSALDIASINRDLYAIELIRMSLKF